MKKSTIWLLTVVMTITIGVLLYVQIVFLNEMVESQNKQFNLIVSNSLNETSKILERKETLHYLEEDINNAEMTLADTDSISYVLNIYPEKSSISIIENTPYNKHSIGSRYQSLYDKLKDNYVYQSGQLNELILTILRESSSRPVAERADSLTVHKTLETVLEQNGLDNQKVAIAVLTPDEKVLYKDHDFDSYVSTPKDSVHHVLFPHSEQQYILAVAFPNKSDFVFQSVNYIIPSLAFTAILIFVFLYTIITAFRQKKLSEMKSDFVNNMTHELKTPISTISLAAQMLNDNSVQKSPSTLQHLSNVIADESKRLRFQVDKVLQLSVFDDAGTQTALKFAEVDVNSIIASVASTFKIKAEKFNGDITVNLDAENALVYVDEMQFTNVIFNLLDNALKYKREDVEPHLVITTRDIKHNRLEICVQDNGIGISKDNIKRVFDKFYRVSTGNRHDVKGFGIGLAYVKKMIQLFKGTVTIESEIGKGSTFIIQLPLA